MRIASFMKQQKASCIFVVHNLFAFFLKSISLSRADRQRLKKDLPVFCILMFYLIRWTEKRKCPFWKNYKCVKRNWRRVNILLWRNQIRSFINVFIVLQLLQNPLHTDSPCAYQKKWLWSMVLCQSTAIMLTMVLVIKKVDITECEKNNFSVRFEFLV